MRDSNLQNGSNYFSISTFFEQFLKVIRKLPRSKHFLLTNFILYLCCYVQISNSLTNNFGNVSALSGGGEAPLENVQFEGNLSSQSAATTLLATGSNAVARRDGPVDILFDNVTRFVRNSAVKEQATLTSTFPRYQTFHKKRNQRIPEFVKVDDYIQNEKSEPEKTVKREKRQYSQHAFPVYVALPQQNDPEFITKEEIKSESQEKNNLPISVPYIEEYEGHQWIGGPKGDDAKGPGPELLLGNIYDVFPSDYNENDDTIPPKLFKATLNLYTDTTNSKEEGQKLIERDTEQLDIDQPQDDKGKKGKKKDKKEDKKKDKEDKKEKKKEKKKKKKKKKKGKKKGGGWWGPPPRRNIIKEIVSGLVGTVLWIPPQFKREEPILLLDNFNPENQKAPPPPPAPPVQRYFQIPIYNFDDDSSEEDCGGKGKKKEKKGRRESRKKKKKKKGKDSCEGWGDDDDKGKKKGKGKDKEEYDLFQSDLFGNFTTGNSESTTFQPTSTTTEERFPPTTVRTLKPSSYRVTRRPFFKKGKPKVTEAPRKTVYFSPTTERLTLTALTTAKVKPTRRRIQYIGPKGIIKGNRKGGSHSIAKGPMIGTVYTSGLSQSTTTKRPEVKVDDELEQNVVIDKLYRQNLGNADYGSDGDEDYVENERQPYKHRFAGLWQQQRENKEHES